MTDLNKYKLPTPKNTAQDVTGLLKSPSNSVPINNAKFDMLVKNVIRAAFNKLVDFVIGLSRRDYIVEQGVSGIWYYRKWGSGYVELAGTKELVSFSSLSQSGGIYYGSCGGYTYPFTLTGIYTAAPGFLSTSSNTWYWLEGVGLSGIANSYCGRGTNRAVAGIPTVHIAGAWK